MMDLARRMAYQPKEVLPRFVALAMELAGGVSAGVSLLEENPAPGVFRWRYVHGTLSHLENTVTPRDPSLCGIALEQNGPVLSQHPERVYSWFSDANVVAPEILLMPLRVGDAKPAGTLWIIADKEGHFDSEHVRTVAELAGFAGIALQMIQTEKRLQNSLTEQETLAAEMGHRVKNVFAVSEALVRMTMKVSETKEEMGQKLIGRLHALALAHAIVRRSFSPEGTPPKEIDLGALLRAIVEPHERMGSGDTSRFTLTGEKAICGEHAVNGIALVFYELATNAAKYGALSNDAGTVSISWVHDENGLTFEWKERGGPSLASESQAMGFGSKLLDSTVRLQLGGALEYRWDRDGLTVRISIPSKRLAR